MLCCTFLSQPSQVTKTRNQTGSRLLPGRRSKRSCISASHWPQASVSQLLQQCGAPTHITTELHYTAPPTVRSTHAHHNGVSPYYLYLRQSKRQTIQQDLESDTSSDSDTIEHAENECDISNVGNEIYWAEKIDSPKMENSESAETTSYTLHNDSNKVMAITLSGNI